MIEFIQHIDESILQFIHITCKAQYLDSLLPLLRNPYFWSPVYLFLFVFMYKNFGTRGLWWCTFFFVTFVFCDFISASILKPLVQRVRPCNNDALFFAIRELVKCGSGFSFPSSHASNHFGLAFFMITTLQHKYKIVLPLVLIWAILVCYAQLYVAVHYPSDIICGAMLGILFGCFFGKYYNKRFGLLLSQ